MQEKIEKAVSEALAQLGAGEVSFTVERPGNLKNGDYTTNAAMSASSALGKASVDVAEELVLILKEKLSESIQNIEIAGPAFINFTLSANAVRFAIAEADAQGSEWGKNEEKKDLRVGIEYSNPNPFKEIHIGHLMSNVVGEALSRLIENQRATVVRDTFGGDIGPHVAKAIWALRKEGVGEIESAKQIGDAYATGSAAYESDETAKAEIDALNVHLYDIVARRSEDTELLLLWEKGREISMAEFRRLFALLGTHIDYEFFDSDTTEIGMRVVKDGVEKGIFKESEGAIIYDGEKKGLHTFVFITSRGTPTYETKDIGLAFLREERAPVDEVIIVTAVEQSGHFKVFLAALAEIAPQIAKKTQHAAHGLLRLPEGKMSSRKGNVITGAGLIEEMVSRAGEKNADPLIAEQVAVGAVKFMVLRQAPGSDIIFDPEKSLSLEGDSGPYLQYALVRAVKILSYSSEDAGGAEEPAEPYAIERLILHYPEVAARAAREFAPNQLVTYLLELAGAWNSFYASEQVLGSSEESYKMRVTRAFATTMSNGLTLLGIPTPESM